MFPFLSHHGVLGINARNLLFVKPFNPKKAIAFADDKLKTKAYLGSRGIPVARIYARIETREQLRAFDFSQLPPECVLKPNEGFGGEGILILKGRKNGQFLLHGKTQITELQMIEHIEDILDGKFSLGGRRDVAFFEQILIPHDCFALFRPRGLPDIRVVVFNLVPVMAMLRVPTAESEGKANLHLGGLGIGIDIAKGMTTHGAQYHHMLRELPHGGSVTGHQIPYWDEILLISSRIQQITNIGYLAADITIDQQMGPALLEVNARAGLTVQVANLAPLRSRLERVQGLKVSSPEKGVRIGQDLFGEKVHRRTAGMDDRPLLGAREIVSIAAPGSTMEVPCLIAPDRERTIFSPSLITELLEKNAIEKEASEEPTFRVKFTLGGRKIQTVILAGPMPTDGPERALIGRRDLAGFLIDPTKQPKASVLRSTTKSDLRATDSTLATLDRDLLLLRHLKPLNLAEERVRLLEDPRYNPVFLYPDPVIDLDEAARKLEQPVQDDSPLGILLEKKRRELVARVMLLRARGSSMQFTQASQALFGAPTAVLSRAAKDMLQERDACDLPEAQSTHRDAEKTATIFREVLSKYGLHDWDVTVREKLVADCTVGGNSLYIRAGATFSPSHINALIAHEIETHILTAENGEHQPVALLRRGCAGYLDTQEGLAVWNQNRALSPYHEKRFWAARSVLAVAYALEHSFADTRRYLEESLGYEPQKAMSKTIDVKRGLSQTREPGAFTKGIVYFRGLRAIEQFVHGGGDLKRLYIGKVALEDLELIEKIPDLKAPLLLPQFLRESLSMGKGRRKK